jgi:hypothetical protein
MIWMTVINRLCVYAFPFQAVLGIGGNLLNLFVLLSSNMKSRFNEFLLHPRPIPDSERTPYWRLQPWPTSSFYAPSLRVTWSNWISSTRFPEAKVSHNIRDKSSIWSNV